MPVQCRKGPAVPQMSEYDPPRSESPRLATCPLPRRSWPVSRLGNWIDTCRQRGTRQPYSLANVHRAAPNPCAQFVHRVRTLCKLSIQVLDVPSRLNANRKMRNVAACLCSSLVALEQYQCTSVVPVEDDDALPAFGRRKVYTGPRSASVGDVCEC